MRPVDAAKLFRPRIDVDKSLARRRNVEERVGLRGLLAQPASDQENKIGAFHAREQLGIGADAEIAGVAGMLGMKEMSAAERGGDRQREPLGKTRDRGAGRGGPSASA